MNNGREEVDDFGRKGGGTSEEARLGIDGSRRVSVARSSVDDEKTGKREQGKGDEGDHVAGLK